MLKKCRKILIFTGLLALLLSACSPQEKEAVDPLEIVALKGPTAMGMGELFSRIEKGENPDFTYKVVGSPEEAVAMFGAGEGDIFALPTNMAAILYHKTGDLKIAGVNTGGVLYLASKGEVLQDLSQVKGKTVILSGKGGLPDRVFQLLLEKAGVRKDEVHLEYTGEHGETLAVLVKDSSAIGLLPEPFLQMARMNEPELHQVYNLNERWEQEMKTPLITGVTVVKKEVAEKDKERVEKFLQQQKSSIDFMVGHPEEGGKILGDLKIFPEPVAKAALPNTALLFLEGEEMKNALDVFYTTLYGENPEAIGGNVPDEDIYFP